MDKLINYTFSVLAKKTGEDNTRLKDILIVSSNYESAERGLKIKLKYEYEDYVIIGLHIEK